MLDKLVEISRYYGGDSEYVMAGGGNTSYKTEDTLWVKASGYPLATITEAGFAALDRAKLNAIAGKTYSEDPMERESQIKNDLFRSNLYPEKGLRPSVESSLHNIIDYAFVVHTHPTIANALLCSNQAEVKVKELFPDEALFVSYTDPGYLLFKKVSREIESYRQKYHRDPSIIMLQNHGVFVAADSPEEIKTLHDHVIATIRNEIKEQPDLTDLKLPTEIEKTLPALRMMLSDESLKVLRCRRNRLTARFAADARSFAKADSAFTPDHIVYCKAHPLYIEETNDPETVCSQMQERLKRFRAENGYDPKVIVIRGIGVVAAEDTVKDADTVLDVYENTLKISRLSENFGGPHFMGSDKIAFVDNWEVENYRRKVSKSGGVAGELANRTAVVTGGAQGFGAGIAEKLILAGANVVVADLAEDAGRKHAEKLNRLAGKNEAVFVAANVAEETSVQNIITTTVETFGGIDLFISNAGVLRAGGLDEMDAETFDFMTDVNYKGYFLCAKYAAAAMKLQHQYQPEHFMDIIQVNSKSGLKGSNRNFAYAGGKFGGIGLTQSFALELIHYNIKVNAVCPGNFFDGPLWADPEKGLFVQYLKAGKVLGAKTLEDVKRHYEQQVPMRRGCRIEDLMRAIEYIIGQKYETGQAVPVTGGQNMLK